LPRFAGCDGLAQGATVARGRELSEPPAALQKTPHVRFRGIASALDDYRQTLAWDDGQAAYLPC
jgi:hypothetical protein